MGYGNLEKLAVTTAQLRQAARRHAYRAPFRRAVRAVSVPNPDWKPIAAQRAAHAERVQFLEGVAERAARLTARRSVC